MQKFSSMAIAVGLILIPLKAPASLTSATAQSTSSGDGDTPLCYMQTTSRGLVDLSYLCQQQLTPPPPSNPQVVVLDVQRSGDRVLGQVRNDTGKPVRFAIVNYAVASSATPAIEASFTYVTPESLQPGQIGSFTGTVSQPGTVTVTSVDWEAEPNS
ncbi:MAG: hypothetical protein KME12_06575 [Trichocoleus desertorum ATA4-8-CV12]|jgi:hypothetical protein|nr:hypothetical protein [Trichocoleus desertorum ATA4-8-CV12]